MCICINIKIEDVYTQVLVFEGPLREYLNLFGSVLKLLSVFILRARYLMQARSPELRDEVQLLSFPPRILSSAKSRKSINLRANNRPLRTESTSLYAPPPLSFLFSPSLCLSLWSASTSSSSTHTRIILHFFTQILSIQFFYIHRETKIVSLWETM